MCYIRVKSCCCCFTLETGCMIIGTMDLLSNIAWITAGAYSILNFTGAQFIASPVAVIIISTLTVIAAAFLIFGVMEKSPRFLFLWLLMKASSLLLLCTMFVWVSVTLIATGILDGAEGTIIALFVLIIFTNAGYIGGSAYCWCVVRSYRKQLIERLPK